MQHLQKTQGWGYPLLVFPDVRRLDVPTIPYPPKSLPLNLFADPHPLNLYATILYRNSGGWGSSGRSVGVFFPFWLALSNAEGFTPSDLCEGNDLSRRHSSRIAGHGSRSNSRLLVDVVLRFQALQHRLEKWFVRLGRSADRLRHLLSGRREITLVRRDPRQPQVPGPVVRILFANQGKQLKRSLGISLPLEGAGIEVELGGRGLIERRGKRLGRFLFLPHGLEDSRFRLQIFKAIFILNRRLFPLQRVFQVIIVVQAPLRRLVVTRPGKSANAPQLVLDALQYHCFHVHGDAEGNRQLLPAQRRQRRIRLDVVK